MEGGVERFTTAGAGRLRQEAELARRKGMSKSYFQNRVKGRQEVGVGYRLYYICLIITVYCRQATLRH